MAERKSKRKAPLKVDEDAEPVGFAKMKQNPLFILGVVTGITLFLIFAIFWLSSFLSEGRFWPF